MLKAEAAYVIDELIQPTSVIPSHANEVATEMGRVLSDTKTAEFVNATEVPVYIPLSGQTMEFNSQGECVAGCESLAN